MSYRDEVISVRSNVVKIINKLLNRALGKKYDWFKNIEIRFISHTISEKRSYIAMDGTIYVDADWGGKQWREYYYDRPIEEGFSFGDIIGKELGSDIREIVLNVFQAVTGVRGYTTSFSWIDTVLVDSDEIEKDMIEESIKRILKEETKKDKMVYRYITSLIQPQGKFKQEYNREAHRFDITDNNDNLLATIFFNNRKEAMEVMIDESIWEAVSEMFSMETWDEVNDSLVKWFQDNYDGLENLEEVTTFDNAEYAY